MRATLLIIAVVAAAIALTANYLPPVVASHFVAGGGANGFMPHGAYLVLMLALAVGLPLLILVLTAITNRLPARYMNLPNRDYWLAPEREAETRDYLAGRGAYFAKVGALFIGYIHLLVVIANAATPPHFPESWLFGGGVVFVIALVAGLVSLGRHFRR